MCRWSDDYHDEKELHIIKFDEDLCCNMREIWGVLVIYLKPDEENFWRLCSASSIPGEALIVDRSWEGEPLFLGYREGHERISSRLGYVRQGKGLMHFHAKSIEGLETRWEVTEGFWVLCARKMMFE